MPAARFTPRHKLVVDLLREARIANGLTQQQVADRLGKHQSLVNKIERQERRLDVVEFLDLAEAIGVSPEAILRNVKRAERSRS
jgi:transcriptional regulator with XRE-family HTH domain